MAAVKACRQDQKLKFHGFHSHSDKTFLVLLLDFPHLVQLFTDTIHISNFSFAESPRKMFLYIFGVLTLLHCTNAYFVNVDAHAEECFFERVTTGTKLGKYH